MKILEKIWHGSIYPRGRKTHENKIQHKLTQMIIRREDRLTAFLSDEATVIFEN